MFDTIIIGSGIAGLAAGQCLIESGHSNFLILESGNKIGGRIRTIEFQGKLFSIGPGWLHGQKGNPIYDIFNDLGVQIKMCDGDNFFAWDVKEKNDVTKQFEEIACIFEETFLDVMDKIKNTEIAADQSVSDVLQTYSDIFKKESDIYRTAIFATKEIYLGAPMKEVSGRIELQLDQIHNLDDTELDFKIVDPMGLTKLISFLSENFTDKIQINSKVVTIQWDEGGHVATVIINDGTQLKCKNVILTLQCDMLAKNVINFEPELPKLKISAWQHVHSVNYCRIFAKFPRRFWPNKDWLLPIISNVDPFDELILWQNGYKQSLCSKDDNILICHFTTGYSRGQSRFDVEKKLLIEMVTDSMKSMFPETYCAPVDVLFVSHWQQDRFAGAFSIIAPGFNDEMIEVLRKSVGPLHFAGESVSVGLTGTMQAAYITGRKAAISTLN